MNRSQRAGKENTYNKKNAVEPAITTKGADRMRKKRRPAERERPNRQLNAIILIKLRQNKLVIN